MSDSAAQHIATEGAIGLSRRVTERLAALDRREPTYVGRVIEVILAAAVESRVSDVHFRPCSDQMLVQWRVDGVLQSAASIPPRLAPNILARLKVLADLLTYRMDIPQEGRLRESPAGTEMRLSTFPTLHGEKGVVRIFAAAHSYQWLADLGLPDPVRADLELILGATSGALLITGPAGSGKTTSAYACLREIGRDAGDARSLVTLEDPIETIVPEATQSQVSPGGEFNYATGLRSLMRQDPDVILVGEVRDRETAETVFQACLTGHLVLSTFHAGSAAEAICRLNDLGIESYLLRAGLRGILCQRLFRTLCGCAHWSTTEIDRMGFDVERVRVPVGCPACDHQGYRGRLVLAELLVPSTSALRRAILDQSDVGVIARAAAEEGMVSIEQQAHMALAAGQLSPAEVRRILGLRVRTPISAAPSPPGEGA